MRIKLTLAPDVKNIVLPVNCNFFLTSLLYKIISNSSKDYSAFLHDEGYKLGENKKGFKLFTYSMLMGDTVRVKGEHLIIGESPVQWQIASPVDTFIQHLITGVFAEGQKLNIGPEGRQATFLIRLVETVRQPEFRDSMKFTCLSPITVSKPAGRGRPCHYLRPWEDGFSEAVRDNLINKYSLAYNAYNRGRDLNGPEFNIKIDASYMNRKSGRITKKINFKGTDIIGFMAPFEVTGSPELIGTGYEAGFGDKGSMGFGMVREIV